MILYAEGYTGKQISEITGYGRQNIYELCRKYLSGGGIDAIIGNHYSGNQRNMTFEQEAAFLEQFIDDTGGGYIADVPVIKAAYDKKIGRETKNGQIYQVLHRHVWTKRTSNKHLKNTDLEAVEGSKKFHTKS